MPNIDKFSQSVQKLTKCAEKKCKKTYKKLRKEISRYTRALHKKCDKKQNFYQCRETVDRSKMNALDDKYIQCSNKKCKKETHKFHYLRLRRSLGK